jgi:multidrug resistance efflux pump
LIDAQKDESRSLLEYQIAKSKLKTLGLDDEAIKRIENEKADHLDRFTLRSPVDGAILELDAKVGGLYRARSILMRVFPGSTTNADVLR